MKKLLFLALAVSLIAGSAFAMTDPAFSGSFEYYNSFEFDSKNAEAGDSGDAKITLNGVVDEWSTVNAEIENDDITYNSVATPADSTTTVMVLNRFSLTTDLTGALGIESPVGVTITWGAFTYEPATFADKAGYEDIGAGQETNTYLGLQIDLDFMGVATLTGTIWPQTYLSATGGWLNNGAIPTGNAAFAIELVVPGVMGMFDANVYYTRDLDSDDDGAPTPIHELGTTVGITIPGNFELGFVFEWYLPDDEKENTGELGIAAAWALGDMLALGAAFGASDLTNFGGTATVAVNIAFAPITGLQFYGSFGLTNFNAVVFQYEVGIQAALGATTYTIGWTDGSEFRTPDWSYDPYTGRAIYLKVSADY